jgi:predicted kinase
LSAPGEPEVVVISADNHRAELYGETETQGSWPEIEAVLHQRICEAVASGHPVIVDATHVRRPWRLALVQALELPAPVEWIGWWLKTPLATCLEWNQQRSRQVPPAVIIAMAKALEDKHFQPSHKAGRREGFASIVEIELQELAGDLEAFLQGKLNKLDQSIRAGNNKLAKVALHGYSRMLDIERLLYLIRLLSRFPELSTDDAATRNELEALVSPLPEGDLAERAAAFLSHLHGRCYGDAAAIRVDLQWLDDQDFCRVDASRSAIAPPPPRPGNGSVHGGMPALADRSLFVRVFTLLRHVLQTPFDRQTDGTLRLHLIERLKDIPGAYQTFDGDNLRKDFQNLLTPYGFRVQNDNVRHGYALGTALLSAPRLREVHAVVRDAAVRLSDPTAQVLLKELEDRLRWGDIEFEQQPPVRAFANRSIISPALVRSDCLAAEGKAEPLETAIVERRWVLLDRYVQASRFDLSPAGELRVWPLQLLFHNIGWYLVFEEGSSGGTEGLIRCERLDRISLRTSDARSQRSEEDHRMALIRLSRLLHCCGGIFFGWDAAAQRELANEDPRIRGRQLETLRFSCLPEIFAFIREGLQRYPIEQVRLSNKRKGDTWWHHPKAPHVLKPNDADDTHPYPVEIDLPRWTLAEDIDLRNWLYGFGGGIRIESPQALKDDHINKLRGALLAYGHPGHRIHVQGIP